MSRFHFHLKHCVFLFLVSQFVLGWAASIPVLSVSGTVLSWSALSSANAINVHRGDGSYIESLPGDSSSWSASSPGEYFIVATSDDHWSRWLRSETVKVGGSHNGERPSPTVDGSRLVWTEIQADGINVHHAEDGSYIESIPGDSTSWLAPRPGGYFLVAVVGEDWRLWKRSSVVTVEQSAAGSAFSGVAFGPYVDGSDPDLGAAVSASSVSSLLSILQSSGSPFRWLRTYGATNGLEHVTSLAHDRNFKLAHGAWINSDSRSNSEELDAAIAAAVAGQVDAIIVGSEALLRRDISEANLLALIDYTRARVPSDILVSYADVYHEYLARPALLEAVDFICAHLHPYWTGVSIDRAVDAINAWFSALSNAAKGKDIWVCESGWPTDGSTFLQAVPTIENSVYFLTEFVSWAEAREIPYFFFEAFDEPWKVRLEGNVGDHWGIFDRFGNLKPGMSEPLLDGIRVPDRWSEDDFVVGGPGSPLIAFTSIPTIGSNEDLVGHVRHVNPTVHAIAVYIRVRGGWWSKPTFAHNLTVIAPDGTWQTDITTGGIDALATEIAAYLLPVEAPHLAGASGLPPELENLAITSLSATRNQ